MFLCKSKKKRYGWRKKVCDKSSQNATELKRCLLLRWSDFSRLLKFPLEKTAIRRFLRNLEKQQKNENFVDVDDVDVRGGGCECVMTHRHRVTTNRNWVPVSGGSLSIRYRGVLTVWGVRYRRYRTPSTVARIRATNVQQRIWGCTGNHSPSG